MGPAPAGCPETHPGLPFQTAWRCGLRYVWLTAEGWDPRDPDLCCSLSHLPHRVPRQGRTTHPEKDAAEGDTALEPHSPQVPWAAATLGPGHLVPGAQQGGGCIRSQCASSPSLAPEDQRPPLLPSLQDFFSSLEEGEEGEAGSPTKAMTQGLKPHPREGAPRTRGGWRPQACLGRVWTPQPHAWGL